MPRRNKRRTQKQLSTSERFRQSVNQALGEAAGATTGGHEMPENNRTVNDWMRQQARRGTLDVPLRGDSDEEQ